MNIILSGNNSEAQGVCGLGQNSKPAICLLYPLGRISFYEEIEGERAIFIRRECPATKTGIKVSITDFIGDYEERSKLNLYFIKNFIKIVERVSKLILDEETKKDLIGKMIYHIYTAEESIKEKIVKCYSLLKKLENKLNLKVIP